MDLKKAKFLLDENLDIKLTKVIANLGFDCTTLREKGWTGYKNGELSVKVKENDLILITADKDFTYLWEKYSIKVIYVTIHPLILENIKTQIIELLENWNYNIKKPFLIILQKEAIRIRQ